MPRTKRFRPVFLVIAVVGGLIAWLLLSGGDPTSHAPFEAEGVTLQAYTSNAEVAWEVRADEGVVREGQSVLDRATIDFFTSNEGKLTATAGRLARTTGSARLFEGVVVQREDGLYLKTDEMTWNEAAGTLITEAIDLRFDDLVVRADRFSYDLEQEMASLEGSVHVIYEGSQPFEATGDRASESEGTFRLEGHVEIADAEDRTFLCDVVTVEAGTAEPGEEAKQVIRLAGQVQAEIGKGQLQAEELTWDEGGTTARGRVSLRLDLASVKSGQPEVEDDA